MNRIVTQIIQHILSHYRVEVIEAIKEKLSEAVDDFQKRAEETPNPIDDFVLDLIEELLNVEE